MADERQTGTTNKNPTNWRRRLWSKDTDWIKRIVPTAIIGIIVLSIAVWVFLPTATLIGEPAIKTDPFELVLDTAQQKNINNFELWYKANIIIQTTLILTALLAAVFASLTTTENAEHVKKWSVFLTAITAALASVQSTFHIRENIGTFIKASVDLNQLQADYLADRATFADELKSKEPLKPDTQKKLLELHRGYTQKYNIILNDRMHAWSNVGQQSLRPSFPAPPSQPNPAGPSSPNSTTTNASR